MSHRREFRTLLEGEDLVLVETKATVSPAEFVSDAVKAALDELREEEEEEEEEEEPEDEPKSGKQDAGKNKPDEAPGKPAEG